MALAKLKTEAAIVPDSAGASLAPIIILAFRIGVVPNVPTPNKNAITNASAEKWISVVNNASTIASPIKTDIKRSVSLYGIILPEAKFPITAPIPKKSMEIVTPGTPNPVMYRNIGSRNVHAVNTPEKPNTMIAITSITLLFLIICNSPFNLGGSAGFRFGVTIRSPINAIRPMPTINQNTYRQLNMPPINEPNGTPSITAIVSPPFTAAIAAGRLSAGEIFIAMDIHKPKKGACIIAEHSLDKIIILNVGAMAAITLLKINNTIMPINSGFGENFIVITRSNGPNIATPIA